MPEKIIIGISVENKIAKADKNAVIVCGNSNYKAVFAFDGEWEGYNVKTALFATDKADNDGNGTIAVVFEGNECDIPPLENTTIVGVGVASGDLTQGEAVELATTTPAYIDCLLSIKDLGGVIAPPAPDVYDQIIALLNKYLGQGGGGSGGTDEERVREIVAEETADLQPKVDDGLETESKSVVGAINETNSKALATIESSIADGTYSVKLVFQNAKGEAIAETTLDLPLSEFVKFTDYANDDVAGVLRAVPSYGFTVDQYGIGQTVKATNADIDDKTSQHKPIVPENGDYFLLKSITTNTETLTDEEQGDACRWIGAAKEDNWELINKVTLTEEAKSIRCETDSNGNEFLLKKVVFIVRSQPSTAATGNATLYYCVSTMKNRATSSTVHQIGELGAGVRTTAQQNAAYVEQKCYIPSGRVEGQGLVILSVSVGENGSLKPKYLTRDIRPNVDEQHITTAYVESGSDTTIFGVGSELEIWGIRA